MISIRVFWHYSEHLNAYQQMSQFDANLSLVRGRTAVVADPEKYSLLYHKGQYEMNKQLQVVNKYTIHLLKCIAFYCVFTLRLG